MDSNEDVASMLPLIPLILRSPSLVWPPAAIELLKALALGPDISRVDSGESLFNAILQLRESVGLANQSIAKFAADGFELFFDELMSRTDSRLWFGEVVPQLARLLLQFPSLLESHYRNTDEKFGERKAGLRVLGKQEAGFVFLSQELIAALLACAMFCLFPTSGRCGKNLPTTINFDYLFAALRPNTKPSQEHKIKCLVHYFERLCIRIPTGFVSYQRKVLPFEQNSQCVSYPHPGFWRKSDVPICSFEVFSSGLIEDQKKEALEVDFANEYLGGGALHKGCVQEEIRFMINPELIIGMLFVASMEENEAIEIVGTERFSSYSGYGSSFCFMGDYIDDKPCDFLGRRKTRIIAIDALYSPGMRQYGLEFLVREMNKAFVGFLDPSKYGCYLKYFEEAPFDNIDRVENEAADVISNSVCSKSAKRGVKNQLGFTESLYIEYIVNLGSNDNIGIATGNWGCGAFGGDPEIKSIIQWLAASQAFRPFVQYYTFKEAALTRLEEVTQWILSHGWTVGELWSMLVEYSSQRLNGGTNVGFLQWLLPAYDASGDYLDYMSE